MVCDARHGFPPSISNEEYNDAVDPVTHRLAIRQQHRMAAVQFNNFAVVQYGNNNDEQGINSCIHYLREAVAATMASLGDNAPVTDEMTGADPEVSIDEDGTGSEIDDDSVLSVISPVPEAGDGANAGANRRPHLFEASVATVTESGDQATNPPSNETAEMLQAALTPAQRGESTDGPNDLQLAPGETSNAISPSSDDNVVPPLFFTFDPFDIPDDEQYLSAIVIYNLGAAYQGMIRYYQRNHAGEVQQSGTNGDLMNAVRTSARLIELSLNLMGQRDTVNLTATQCHVRGAVVTALERAGDQILGEMRALLLRFEG